jgi:hypothetical protein
MFPWQAQNTLEKIQDAEATLSRSKEQAEADAEEVVASVHAHAEKERLDDLAVLQDKRAQLDGKIATRNAQQVRGSSPVGVDSPPVGVNSPPVGG